jgi:4-diphosphocytidyl-2C-methyl-D-erythritol 2-phosphate synthase
VTEPLNAEETGRPRLGASGPVRVRVPAKINLHLGVGPIRPDGYHELTTVYHAISLYDEVSARRGDQLTLTMEGEGAGELALDDTNLVIRAAHVLAKAASVPALARLHLRKQIPIAGGLAGGSADAAAALVACDALWGTGMSRDELADLAAEVGSDVPFLVLGGTALDVWRKLARGARVPMPVCDGSAQERAAAIEALNSDRRVLIDPVTLLSLHVLGHADLLCKLQSPPCITQSALDLFDQQIAMSRTHADGYIQVIEEAGQKYRIDITAEDVAAEIREWQRVRTWAEQNCEVVTAIPQSDLSPNVAEALQERLGQAHYDALLAVQGGRYVLFCDDHWLRRVAAHSFAASGVWTQAFLMWAEDRNWLSFPEYVECVVTLAQWRYTFTSVSAEGLMLVAASNDARMLERFSTLSAQLNLAINHIPELVKLTVHFLSALWSSQWHRSMKERLTYTLLNGIAPHNSPHCHQFLRRVIAYATAVDTPAPAVLCVIDWMHGHFIWHAFRKHLDSTGQAAGRHKAEDQAQP